MISIILNSALSRGSHYCEDSETHTHTHTCKKVVKLLYTQMTTEIKVSDEGKGI